MRIVAGQSIRGQDHHGVEFPALRPITQSIQRRPVESCAAAPLIEKFMVG
jgi:hypothetical protein